MNRDAALNHHMSSLFRQILSGDHAFEPIRVRSNKQILRVPLNWSDRTAEIDLFVKVYNHTSLKSRFKARTARSGGYHDWHICCRLIAAGLCVPRPIGRASEPLRTLLPRKTLFAQEWIADGQTLSNLLHQKSQSGQISNKWLNRLYDTIGKFVATIHQCGFSARDMHPGNLLLSKTSGEELNLMLIDYESIRHRRLYRRSKVQLDLGHICSYLDGFAPDTHERLSAAYRSVRPHKTPPDLAAKVMEVARKHSANRQKRVDRAFEQIALIRRNN